MAQLARDYFALEPDLGTVVDMLPVASTASREIRTRSHPALGARAEDFANFRDRVIAALGNYLDVQPVSRHCARDHHSFAVPTADAEGSECHRTDFYFRHAHPSLSALRNSRDATYN